MAVKASLIGRSGLIVRVGGTAGGERDDDLTIQRFDRQSGTLLSTLERAAGGGDGVPESANGPLVSLYLPC